MKRYMASQESGRSMIEMLGVLAIIGVLSVGGIAGYSMAMSKFKTTKSIDQIQTITTNVRTLLASQRRWPSISSPAIWYTLGILTEETYDGSKGVNSYGGNININSGTSATRVVSIQYTGIPQDACVKLGTTDWGSDPGSGLMYISIGSNTYVWEGTSANNQLPPDVTNVVTHCGNKNSNTITWGYK